MTLSVEPQPLAAPGTVVQVSVSPQARLEMRQHRPSARVAQRWFILFSCDARVALLSFYSLTCVFAPVVSWMRLRDMEEQTEKHWKKPPPALLRPRATSSCRGQIHWNYTGKPKGRSAEDRWCAGSPGYCQPCIRVSMQRFFPVKCWWHIQQ